MERKALERMRDKDFPCLWAVIPRWGHPSKYEMTARYAKEWDKIFSKIVEPSQEILQIWVKYYLLEGENIVEERVDKIKLEKPLSIAEAVVDNEWFSDVRVDFIILVHNDPHKIAITIYRPPKKGDFGFLRLMV